MNEAEEYHVIETKVYDSEGELIAAMTSYVPWEFRPSQATLRYWDWLDERREAKAEEV